MAKQFRTYRFTNKDPVCDEVASLVNEAGLRGRQHTGKIATLATLAKATVDALLYGATRQPRNSTVMAIATSLGYERRWQRTTNKFELEAELKKAREFIRAQAKLKEKAAKSKSKKRKPRAKVTKGGHLRLVASKAA
jgi:hypothetical protein